MARLEVVAFSQALLAVACAALSPLIKKVTATYPFLSDYRKALPYLEKYRKLAPDQGSRWAVPLYTIYLNLNMGKEFDEMDKILRK